MSDTKSTASSGIGLTGFVFIVFLALKLAEIGQVATWSWWWVTSPLWIPFAFAGALMIVVGVPVLIAKAIFG